MNLPAGFPDPTWRNGQDIDIFYGTQYAENVVLKEESRQGGRAMYEFPPQRGIVPVTFTATLYWSDIPLATMADRRQHPRNDQVGELCVTPIDSLSSKPVSKARIDWTTGRVVIVFRVPHTFQNTHLVASYELYRD